ncbi:hypothetical protein [Pseudovibrio sp. Ad26]|uniref:hypothetical protein n=1 Tax=Pseudovibrio sp. Ad26 TaxID=989410 RepID=UPI0007AE9EEC|nr:hypothetical protein [Pseudovibrio sp. Ad26]KZL11703.1 hypothetical protein PsAD26_02560 [Pseudovibrio sp. Ad26]
MADFSDISNWRQEFYEFNERDDEETKEFYDKLLTVIPPMIPVSQVLEFMEVLFQHDELREAVKKGCEWDKVLIAHGNELPDMSNCPYEATQTRHDFFHYFCWKSEYEPVSEAFLGAGVQTLCQVLEGKLLNVQAPETRDFLLKEYSNFICK